MKDYEDVWKLTTKINKGESRKNLVKSASMDQLKQRKERRDQMTENAKKRVEMRMGSRKMSVPLFEKTS